MCNHTININTGITCCNQGDNMKDITELRQDLIKANRERKISRKELKEVASFNDDSLAAIETEDIEKRNDRFKKAQEDTKKCLGEYITALMDGISEKLSDNITLVDLIEAGNIHLEVDYVLKATKAIIIRNKSVKPVTKFATKSKTNGKGGKPGTVNRSGVVGFTQKK